MISTTHYPWLFPTWQTIVKQVEREGLTHALLVQAPAGFGKHVLANELARLLLCQGDKGASQARTEACNECQSCTWFSLQERAEQKCHPDYYPITSNSESGVLKIDEIRSLVNHMGQTANQGGWKISIIFKAHRLNIQASNAFLKTLEEPTKRTLFILLADNLHTLPLTILSRVQHISLSLNDETEQEQARTWLLSQGDYQEKEVNQALFLANNAPLLAHEFLQNNKIEEYQEWLKDIEKLQNHHIGSMEIAKKWQTLKETNITWLYQLIHHRLTQLSDSAHFYNYAQWLLYAQTLKKQQNSWLQNLNELLVLQTAYAGWQSCYHGEPLP